MTARNSARWVVFVGSLALLLDGASSCAHREAVPGTGTGPKVEVPAAAATWKSIAAGRSTTLAVKRDGTLWVWGWNGRGGDSDGHLERAPRIEGDRAPVALPPTRVGNDSDWASVAVGDGSLMALKTNGTMWGWSAEGRSRSRQDEEDRPDDADDDAVDEQARPPKLVPAAAGFPLPHQLGTDSDWRQLSTAAWNTMGVRTDGTLWGWGSNRNGELGDGTKEERTAPVRIGKEQWRQVATSALRTVAIRQDGTLWIWGWRLHHADTGPEHMTSPLQIGADAGWGQVGFSGGHLLALKTDGTLWSCGSNQYGELARDEDPRGNGCVLGRVGRDNDWTAVSAGSHLSIALKRDGSLWAWGINYQGQLGDGTTEVRKAPVRVGKDVVWRAVHAGETHVVAEATDGSTWTWGDNLLGQLGDGRPLVVLAPTQVQPGSKWRFAAGDEAVSIGLRDDGELWTWGSSPDGNVVKSQVRWKQLAHYRGENVIGIQQDGSLWDIWWHDGKLAKITKDIWGKQEVGERWARLTATQHGVLVQDEQDGLWQLGRVRIGSGDKEREVWEARRLGKPTQWGPAFAEVNPAVILAQKKDGTLWLFEQSWNNDKAPVLVDKKANWQRVIAGDFELLLLGKDGTLWRFDGESKERIGSSEWLTASVSRHHTVAVRKDGSLWSWGQGEAGELGTVYAGEQPSPVRIGKDSDWAQVFAAPNHCLAIKTDGTLWAWGNNLNGQLGVGAARYRRSPIRMAIP